MAKILSVSIDVTKIPKEKIIIGKKGKYVNLSIFINDEKNQFGDDVSVSLSQTKEEREDNQEKIYLGNGKIVWANEKNNGYEEVKSVPKVDYDLPF